MSETIVLTDYAWPDCSIERELIESAGLKLVVGRVIPSAVEAVEDMVRMHNPVGILTCWAKVSTRAIKLATRLKVIARMGVGLDNIAVDTATQRGVWVTNVPDFCVEEVSDHAVAFALAWTRGLLKFDRQVRSGIWNPAGAKLRCLGSLTCGIVGMGKLGTATARKLTGFGCRVVAYTRSPRDSELGVEFLDLDSLLHQSDIVIIHLPLTPNTRHLFDAQKLQRMKPHSLLINVSRGAVVETNAVLAALQSGRLSAIALDVLEEEPEIPAELLKHEETLITPHIAFSSETSILELRRRAAAEVLRVVAGKSPLNPCNAPIVS